MLAVDFDPNRPHDQGQFHVRLIGHHQNQMGYWCDLDHLVSGILSPVLCHVPDDDLERVREYARPKERLELHDITRFMARCSCGWSQQHTTPENARRDGVRHMAEWHHQYEEPF